MPNKFNPPYIMPHAIFKNALSDPPGWGPPKALRRLCVVVIMKEAAHCLMRTSSFF